MQQLQIAVSHASSVLGEAVLERFHSSKLPADQLVVLDSEERRGTRLVYGDTYLVTRDQHSFDYSDCGLFLLLEPDEAIEAQARSQGCFILGCVADSAQPMAYLGSALDDPGVPYGADCARLPRAETSCVLDVLLALHRQQAIAQIQLSW